MSDSIIYHSKYNINSSDELTLEEYNDTIEISLCHKARTLFKSEQYYIKCKRAKANIEEVVELYDSYTDSPLSKYLSEFEDTCFYWYVTSMRNSNTSIGNELSFIHERDFYCGAYISNHIFNHKDNSFTFQIKYNGRSYESFANKIQTIINKKLTVNELIDCFWQITNKEITFNKHLRDVSGNINGSIEMYKLTDTKSFFNIVIPELQSYLYRLSKVR